jgi:alpha-beta hydrolase superfamily lysophospholipase
MRLFLSLFVLILGLGNASAAEEARELTVGGRVVLGTLRTPQVMGPETPIVVMTHGTLAHKDMETMVGLAKALAERGVATITHTLALGLDRRRGMYDCAEPHDYMADDAIAEIAAWVGEAQRTGAKRVFVLGHSRGGNQVARYLSARLDAPVAGAVLLAPATASFEAAGRAAYAATYGAELEPLLGKAAKLVADGQGGEWMQAPGFIYCRNAKVTARAFAAFYTPDVRQDTAALIAAVSLPVLVLAGSKDTTVTDVVGAFAPRAGTRIHLDTVDDADHYFLDLAAEDAADRIAAFVRGP